jgi:hypothetical protein
MISKPSIGEMRFKIQLKTPSGQVSDGAGGLTAGSLSLKREFYVKADQMNSKRLQGLKALDASQQILSEAWLFTGLRRKELDPTSSDVVIFEGQEMQIISVVNDLVYTEIMAHRRDI